MKQRIIYTIFVINLFFLALTGFAQMPIFKRYYIADIPGLGWLAKFYVTHYLHYLAAAAFLGLVSYIIADLVLSGPLRQKRLSLSGAVRGLILTVITTTGIFLVIRNLSGVSFAADFIIFMDLSHLGAVMLYLMTAVYCLVSKKSWTTGQ